MAPAVDPVISDEVLPQKADVVVIGAGIIGVCASLYLAERGLRVVLCEKGKVAGEQSSRNWGWVRTTGRDSREMPLILEAQRLWDLLSEQTGVDVGLRRPGIAYLAETEKKVAGFERWLEMARDYQTGSRLVTGAELEALVPGARMPFKAALYTPNDGRAEPQRAAPAIAEAARSLGVKIYTRCAARGLEKAGGRVSGVVTERGSVACDAVVLAGGAWSRLFCRRHELSLPQLKVRASVFRTSPLSDGPSANLWSSKVALRRRLDGGYTIANGHDNVVDLVPDHATFFFNFLPALCMEWRSLKPRLNHRFIEEWRQPGYWALDEVSPFEGCRVLDPEPVARVNEEAWQAVRTLFPVFQQARIEEAWAGMIDVTPDAIPVVSEVKGLPGFFIATGFSGHGFGIGPGAGHLVADLVSGNPSLVDPSPFRFSRFSEGSRPRPESY